MNEIDVKRQLRDVTRADVIKWLSYLIEFRDACLRTADKRLPRRIAADSPLLSQPEARGAGVAMMAMIAAERLNDILVDAGLSYKFNLTGEFDEVFDNAETRARLSEIIGRLNAPAASDDATNPADVIAYDDTIRIKRLSPANRKRRNESA